MSRELLAFEGRPSSAQAHRGSDRSFGRIIAGICELFGILPLLHGREPSWWLVALGGVFFFLSWLAPKWLAPLNKLWFWVGKALGALMEPLIMSIIFFAIVTPTALIQRWTDRDILGLRYTADAKTYWKLRNPPGPEPDSLKNQF